MKTRSSACHKSDSPVADQEVSAVNRYRVLEDTLVVLSEVQEMTEHIHRFMRSLHTDAEPAPHSIVRLAIFRAPKRSSNKRPPVSSFILHS